MANTKREKLFTEFPPVSTEQWEAAIAVDLKGADYERKLVWRTGEGFNVRPYYRAENLEGIQFLGSQAGEFPYVRGTRANNHWRVHQTVEVNCPKEANAEALKLGTIETAKESQRGVVDIETLQQTNKSLIETLDELNKIQTEGRAKRAAAEQELTRIEDELKSKMMEIRS